MYKIKLDESEKITLFYKVEVGNYNHKVQYKINLSDKTYSLFEAGEEKFMEWESIVEDVESKIEDFIRLVEQKIINNKEVIFSSKINGNNKEVSKAETHLSKNLTVLDFLNNYNYNYN